MKTKVKQESEIIHRIFAGAGNKVACGKHFNRTFAYVTPNSPMWTLRFTTDTSLVTCKDCISADGWRDTAHNEFVNTNPERKFNQSI